MRAEPRAAGTTPAWRGTGSWRDVTCVTGRGTRSCLKNRRRNGTAGAERLAGQMSTDTPRPPHATAREHASTGSTARLCGIRMS